MEIADLDNILHQAMAQRIRQAEQFFNITLPTPCLDLSLRGKAAGQMCAQAIGKEKSYRLRLNLPLAKAHLDCFLDDIIPHEIAHLVVMHCYGFAKHQRVRPHGKEWKYVMSACFNVAPELYHRLEAPHDGVTRKKTAETFLYQCQCQEHQLSKIRHNRSLKGSRYLCVKCKQPIQRKMLPANTLS